MAKQVKSIPVGPVKCEVCTKTVYQMERVTIDGHIMHDKCFKCAHCNKKLSPTTCSSIYNKFYCKPHFMSLFKAKGNYNEGFGEAKDQHKFNAAHGIEASTKSSAPEHQPKPAEAAKPAVAPKPVETPKTEAPKPAEVSKPVEAPKPAETAKPKAAKEPVQAYNSATKKHNIENYSGNTELVVTATTPADGVFVSDCHSCVITVTGKLSNISLLNCSDCGVIFDDIIAAVEINRGKKIQLQANGAVPQILIDCTDSATVTLAKAAESAQIITAQSESINVVIPGDDDDLELPVPYQYVSRVEDGKLVTHCAEHV